MKPIKQINRMLLLACAPFLGIMIWLLSIQAALQLPAAAASVSTDFSLHDEVQLMSSKLDQAKEDAVQTSSLIEKYFQVYEQSSADTAAMLKQAKAQASLPKFVYDKRISVKLGSPTKQTASGNIDVKLFTLHEKNYQGYAMKVNLKSDKAIKLVLGKDKLGSSETTLEAANRYGALAGVNAGGFADDNKGRRFPLDTTVMNGDYLNGFFPSNKDTIFIGLSKERKLIGGKFNQKAELDKLGPQMGTTFVPTLLKDGKKLSIPLHWQTSPARAARTIIGNYKDDQLLFLVTDGNNEDGTSGATLAELQDKLIALGVRDAYNLDGGGSSTLIFDGALINRPSDGKLRPLATHFLLFK
ncbi:phosphodiester glycosidase family protein [Paenibacillus eucommiae]|uniref:Exopolysaccharide biosynthesis protein n=1 Tax=Paenibacillus eucommiae TaxID=1355755 RepID=A0ABS4J0X7_9BACL|nr:phosphodiester glycosidase family protein [Paenibacillus eucommiae]MBP1993450.1 exopolysaccharide biosynthesis protein [Paenibacillus eucommiae]